MIYLTPDDLTAESYQQFITESGGNSALLDKLEARAIDFSRTYLAGRYDLDLVFQQGSPVRCELLAEILSKLLLYRLFRRNAARKVPTDVKDDHDWAVKQLEAINNGRITLHELPVPEDDTGQPVSNSIWGNTTNSDFYI